MSDRAATAVRGPRMPLATMVAGAWVVLVAGITILGADLMWVVALGDSIRAEGGAPAGLPFASAPQVEWHSPIAVAELLLSFVHGFGGAALAGLHVALVALTLLVLVAEGRRLGGGEVATALVISLAVVGASSALVVTRLPSLSLLPFVIAVAVMRRSHERPTRRVWWLVPLSPPVGQPPWRSARRPRRPHGVPRGLARGRSARSSCSASGLVALWLSSSPRPG